MANRTVLIPNETDPFVVKINNDVYSYPAGTEQSVPDEVADVIDNYWRNQPKDPGVAYDPKYTKKEVDESVDKTKSIIANPALAGTEAALEGLQVGETKYKVGGEDIPSITITPEDLPTTFTAIATWLSSISGGWNMKHFELTTSETAAIKAKLEAAYDVNKNIAFMYFGGDLATMANFSGDSGNLVVSLVNIVLPAPLSKDVVLFFHILTGIDNILTFDIFAAPVTVAA